MPEENNMAVDSETTNTSAARNKTAGVGRNVLVQISMLDGTILDVYIEVCMMLKC